MFKYCVGFLSGWVMIAMLHYGNPESERAKCIRQVANGVFQDVKKDVD